MTDLGWPEILIVVVIAMVLFGSRKMPEIARSVGRSMRIVKAELRGLQDDEAPVPAAPFGPPAAAEPVVPVRPVTPAAPVQTSREDPLSPPTR